MRRIHMFGPLLAGLIFVPAVGNAADAEELQALQRKVAAQEAIVQQQQEMIQQLLDKVDALAEKIDAQAGAEIPATPGGDADANATETVSHEDRVDLESDELPQIYDAEADSHVLARPWYKNIHIDGFGGAGFVKTGSDGNQSDGHFTNYEATFNIDVQVWDDITFFTEFQTVRLGDEKTKYARTQEVYAHFKDVFKTFFGKEDMSLGLKLGRLDIPFGEDYLTQDITDNPLITQPAAYPYGVDEGLVLYGTIKGVNWIAAVMDGFDDRGLDDQTGKFVSLKVYGNPTESLYLSASGFRNGNTLKSAFEYGGSHLSPVGYSYPSTLGASTSNKIDAYSYELDGQYDFGTDRYVKLQFGATYLDDPDSTFDRTLYYGKVEPKWNLGPRFKNKLYLVGRFSTIGTYDDDEGYAFDGKPYASGNNAFGYDAKALFRYAAGFGYWLNPRLLIKLEYSKDDYQTIGVSPIPDGSENRDLVGAAVAAKF